MTSPIEFQWDGEAMLPANRYFAKLCDKQFVVGERYRLEEWRDRSQASHNHQFAWLHDAWMNLPENLSELYPTPDHLRKRALIDCGFYDETIIDCGNNAAALRVAAHLRHKDEFAVVIVRGPIVAERIAKSQSRRAMGGKLFEQSKQAILAHIANLIGVGTTELSANAGRAA